MLRLGVIAVCVVERLPGNCFSKSLRKSFQNGQPFPPVCSLTQGTSNVEARTNRKTILRIPRILAVSYGGFTKLGGSPNKDYTILGSILGSLILGNYHMSRSFIQVPDVPRHHCVLVSRKGASGNTVNQKLSVISNFHLAQKRFCCMELYSGT